MRLLIAALVAAFLCLPAIAHDKYGHPNWIYNGAYTSPIDGTHCCGVNDCMELPDEMVKATPDGYRIDGEVSFGVGPGTVTFGVHETVPHREVQVSRDGKYWRCHKADKSRRCFFAPPPSM